MPAENAYTQLLESVDVNDARDIVRLNPETGQSDILISATQLIPTGESKPLSIAGYQWSQDMNKLLIFTNTRKVWRHHTRGDYWVLDRETGDLCQLGPKKAEPANLMFAKFSPDARHVAYVYRRNIYVQNLATQKVRKITRTASDSIINGTSDWVYEEELRLRDAFRWSPDSRTIAYWQFDMSGVGTFKIINYTDSLYPTITELPYPKVGQTNSACRVGVVRATGGRTHWIKIPGDSRNNYIHAMEWLEDSKDLVIQQLNRLQNTHHVYTCTLKKGLLGDIKVTPPKVLFTDTDDAWVDTDTRPRWLEKNQAFLWRSERDGWAHLYRVERDSGEVTLLSPGDYDVIDVQHVDEDKGLIYVTASPDNPTQRYLYHLSLAGGPAQRVTPVGATGSHTYQMSFDAQWAVHRMSAWNQVPRTHLIRLPHHDTVRVLEDNAELQATVDRLLPSETLFFDIPIQDNINLPAWMITPPDFDPTKQYPLLFHVYGEPAAQTVRDRWMGNGGLWHRMLAQQGYIVANIDNRGTPAPLGREWRKSVYEKIGIVASADQAEATRWMLKHQPFIDPNRIAIWGWSGGGSMTLNALFRYPDLYSTGMAVAFVSNQRYYDTIYQERYMGLPEENEEGFKNGSPITFAHQLEGNLLLVYGTGDDNCHYQNCEVLVNKLIEHNKPFTLMAYPNRQHGIRKGKNTTLHLYELLTRYLKENQPVE
ncbi:MAG: S9 family peptidase [Planctomycetes bacterium]|nr:S9 family peptidase [Planctomycetota bacterium]